MPDTPLRILEQEPPPASSFWLDYRDTWLIALPIYLVVVTLVFIAASAFLVAGRREWRAFALLLAPAAAVALAALLAVANLWVDAGGSEASLSASGAAQVEQGEWYGGQLTGAQATLDVTAEDRVRKVTHRCSPTTSSPCRRRSSTRTAVPTTSRPRSRS